MATTNKQRVAIAAIVILGLLGGGAVLLTGKGAAHRDADNDSQAEKKEATKPGEQKTEGVVKLSDEQVQASAIAIVKVGPGKLQEANEFPGEVRFNEDRTSRVVPRLAGVAESVPASLGQLVRKGQVLAVIASPAVSEQRSELLTSRHRLDAARATFEREKQLWEQKISAKQDFLQAQTSLQEAEISVRNARQKLAAVGAGEASTGLNRLEVRSPFDGAVVEKRLSLGEAVKEDAPIFVVSDLKTVWVEFTVAPKDLELVRVGQKVVVSSSALTSKVEGTISYVGSLLGEQTRTARARVVVANPKGAWRPGLFVTVSVQGAGQDVQLAVPAESIQTVDQQPTVFKAAQGGFIATPVKTGRTDGKSVEILEGLKAGDQVAGTNAFVVKAEQGKASAAKED